jgi:hypothetical protein
MKMKTYKFISHMMSDISQVINSRVSQNFLYVLSYQVQFGLTYEYACVEVAAAAAVVVFPISCRKRVTPQKCPFTLSVSKLNLSITGCPKQYPPDISISTSISSSSTSTYTERRAPRCQLFRCSGCPSVRASIHTC